MPDDLYIVKNPELRESKDYALLRAEGLTKLERLASTLWTDYNVHDPGITFLELLCYAITELGYRTGYDIKDLLTHEENGTAVNTSNFHTAKHIFTSNPVTFNDLRKLLIDIEGVRNAWVEKHTSVVYCLDDIVPELVDCPGPAHATENEPVNGLYDVFIEYDDFVEQARIVRFGRLERQTGATAIAATNRGLAFRVQYPMTLEAVSVYADAPGLPGLLTVRLLDDDGIVEELIQEIIVADEKTRVALGFILEPHKTYRLTASGLSLYQSIASLEAIEAYGIKNVVQLLHGAQGGSDTTFERYYFFYDWEGRYAVPPTPQERVYDSVGMAEAVMEGYLDTRAGRGIVFDVDYDLRLEAVSVYAEVPGSVTVRLLDDDGNAVLDDDGEALTAEAEAVDTKTRVALGWDLTQGKRYRLDALGSVDTDGVVLKLHRNTGGAFPFDLPDVITLVHGKASLAGMENVSYYFFYDWEVSYLEPRVQAATITQDDVRLLVKDRLHRYRNLCEDFVNVCDLLTEEIAVCADIELALSANVEEVMAEIFYQVGLHISPLVTFYTIDQLLANGKTTDEIFEGPLLDHGFIDDDEFRAIERRCLLRVSDIIQIIMDVEGVISVKNIELLSFIDGVFTGNRDEWILYLASDRFRVPEFAPDLSKLVFYKKKLPYYANRQTTAELLEEKKAQDIQSKLKGHEQDLPVPVGAFKDLEDYYPVQNELPMTYRVGNNRVPASFDALRHAQSRQLKAYLLLFEQILANYLSQLAHVEELFSWEEGLTRSYFTQVVDDFANPEDIYLKTFVDADESLNRVALEAQLNVIIEDTETAEARKLRFLDHLLGRFAEDLSEYTRLMKGALGDEAAAHVIKDEQAFLADYPALSSQRSKGFDYRDPDDPDNLTGYQRRCYRLLGMHDVQRRPLAGHRFEIKEQSPDVWHFVLRDEDGVIIFESIACDDAVVAGTAREAIVSLLDFALSIGSDTANWQETEDGTAYELVRFCERDELDEVIGTTTNLAVWPDVVAYFAEYDDIEGFHVVEHVLLRKRTVDDPFLPVQLSAPGDCDCPEVYDPYSFRVSVFLPSWSARFQDLKFRQFVEETLRLEAPAHVYPRICWLSHSQMKDFEQSYDAFLTELAALEVYLGGCRPALTEDDPSYDEYLGGELPLPDTDSPARLDYKDALEKLIKTMYNLDNVFPLARLHACEETEGDQPQITLNNTRLGTF